LDVLRRLRYEPDMVTDAPAAVRKLMLPILAVHPEVAKSFLFGLTGQFAAPAEADIDGQPAVFVHFDQAGGGEAALLSSVAIADGLILLLRHLDADALQATQKLLARLPVAATPRIFVVARAAVETEIKMGCPACAQKLRVEVAEAGRTARCPRCEFTFKIPSPEAVLRTGLSLDKSVPVTTAILGQSESCQAAVRPLLELARRSHPAPAAPRVSGAGADLAGTRLVPLPT
jgi:hypothetical protein